MSTLSTKHKVGPLWLSLIVTPIFLPAMAFAMPSVSGSTVSWPDDGWYQVQRSDTYESICEGSVSAESSVSGGACILGSHTYIVINHTSGERFTNITADTSITSDASSTVNSVQVNGDTITWPDNGWYQVQNASNFNSLCNGGRSCAVAPGNYIVINHTTGERFTDIEVPGNTDEPADIVVNGNTETSASIVVDGNTISWPNDGWYQVQNSSNYESVCEGGTACTVPTGKYIVINHSSGERFEDIEVGAEQAVFNLSDATPALLESLVAYSPDQLAPLVGLLAAEAISGASGTGESLADGELTTNDVRFDTVVTAIERTRYNCSGGGTLVREIARVRLEEFNYNHDRNVDGYEFDQCRFTNQQGPLASGDYLITGRLDSDYRTRASSRFGEGDSSYTWNQFSLQGPDGDNYEVNGLTETNQISGASVSTTVNRVASYDYYRKMSDGVIVESITNSSFSQSTVDHLAGIFNSIEIEMAGTVTGSDTQGHDVFIQTDTALSHSASSFSTENYEPFVGQLSLSSSDGSFLTLAANPSGNDRDPLLNLLMDWIGTLANGEAISRTGVLLNEFPQQAANCSFRRDTISQHFVSCANASDQLMVP